MWVGLIQLLKNLNRTKRPFLLQVRWISASLTLSWDFNLFSCLWNISSSRVSSLKAFGLEVYHQLSCFSSFQTQTETPLSALLGLQPAVSFHNHVSQFIHTHVCYWFCSSREHWLLHMPFMEVHSWSLPSIFYQNHRLWIRIIDLKILSQFFG